MAHFITSVKMWIALFQILFLFLCSVLGSPETCIKKGPCRCEYENGTAVDLTNTYDNFYSSSLNVPLNEDGPGFRMIFYYFHPCKTAKLPTNDTNVQNGCENSSLCKRVIEMKQINGSQNYMAKDPGYVDLGSIEMVKFMTGESGNSIVYEKYGNIKTTILLVCVREGNSLVITVTDPELTVLTFYSPTACSFGGSSSHRSLGSTLLIILFVMVLVYIIVECLVKRFLMGAQGLEVIPNLSFWRELPGLVKDGVTFIKNGFKPPPQTSQTPPGPGPNANSYDSI